MFNEIYDDEVDNVVTPCSMCLNARLDDELTDNNDFSSSTIEYNKSNNFRMMLSSGAGKPLRIEAELWSSSVKRWITVGQYYPKFCPECGRKITEYRRQSSLKEKQHGAI